LDKVIEAEVNSKGMTRDKVYHAYSEGTSMKKLIHPNDIADMALFIEFKVKACKWSGHCC
tara:strand:+ start:112 stop:291 length:180 start_codon:yes stop_codon:yes gene_type:complete